MLDVAHNRKLLIKELQVKYESTSAFNLLNPHQKSTTLKHSKICE